MVELVPSQRHHIDPQAPTDPNSLGERLYFSLSTNTPHTPDTRSICDLAYHLSQDTDARDARGSAIPSDGA